MAWIRQLDSGIWAATIYDPDGKRITKTDKSRGIVASWARALEASKEAGAFIDPRLAKTTVGEVWKLYGDGRRLEKASRKRDASHWRTWVGPRWADVPIGTILKPDVSAWVVKLEAGDVGGWTVIASLALLRSLLEIAVDARLIAFNAARGVKTSPPPKHEDRILTDDECDRLIANFYRRFPGVAAAGLFVETMTYCGPRYEELAALRRTSEAVNMRQGILHFRPVLERDGTIREYPKSAAGERDVPVDDDLWPRLREHIETVTPGGLVFTGPGGGALLYSNWLKRVWRKGLLTERPMTEQEVEAWKEERREAGLRAWRARWVVEAPVVADPQPTPHDLRHLFGTRLAEAGVPQHERMALMGHEDERAGRRYVNPRDERFERARAAMKRSRRLST